MAEPKVQLVAPLGNLTVPGMNVTGVVTATLGDVGVAGSIIQGNNIDIGTGIITATSFVGDQIGTYRAASLTGSPDLVVGVVTSSGFVAQITGDVTGNLTGNVVGTAGSILSGNNVRAGIATVAGMSGDGSNLTGIAATSYNTQTVPGSTYSINVTNDGSSAYTLSGTDRNGSVSGNNASVSVEIGDTLNFVVDASGHPFYIRVSDGGANVSTPAATNQGAQSGTVSWTPNTAGTYYYQCGNHAGMIGTITVTATTTIDLSAGNMITFNQSANTTISFANTSTSMDVTIIRVKDTNNTARTITWPDSVKWNGGTAPTLISNTISGDSQQFQFLTRDSGLTWYAWEPYNRDVIATSLFGWGMNTYGSLGQNDRTQRSSPIQVGTDINWDKDGIARGTYSMTAKKTDGTLWMWGDNQKGELGFNDRTSRSSPVQLPGTTWGEVINNYNSVIGTKTDGTLWGWGDSLHGVLGQNQGPGFARSSPSQIGTETTWSNCFVNAMCGMGLKTDGTFWIWGYNGFGGLGLGDSNSRSSPCQLPGTTWGAKMSGHFYGSSNIKTDGTLWAWGRNTNGALGQNNNTTYSSPKQVGTETTWSEIHGGYYSWNMGLKTDGTLWSWGRNPQGNLGHNDQTNYSSPKQVPGTSWSTGATAAALMGVIKTDGTLWTWGDNDNGLLGLNQGGNPANRSSPTQVGTDTTWSTITGSCSYGGFMATQAI